MILWQRNSHHSPTPRRSTEGVETRWRQKFGASVMNGGERSPKRRPGSPLGWPKRRMERPVANEVNEMSGENVSAKWKNISDITKDFRDDHQIKKVNVRDIR